MRLPWAKTDFQYPYGKEKHVFYIHPSLQSSTQSFVFQKMFPSLCTCVMKEIDLKISSPQCFSKDSARMINLGATNNDKKEVQSF